ncbi:MAG: GreA2 [Berkelbacteria bacterium GW2011_GWB1_38_5]|uniref:Transcription elongation factor GreA n=2 Tax=Candidatus Berkelbacteria TaxID=1618330 RepID=A0A0G0LRT0_9BACT|nr:MAG: GreA2 [Berkelbacteria bacterium GW2011_GWB1_38_5]KKQ90675.1 MAG: GreA2 [Berkelbacteria bacterium GW2011_GWA1_39_10]
MPEKILLTQEGFQKIQTEIATLKERRKQVSERIRNAREYGDLSENSEYEDAKNEQSFVEGRILELEEMVRHSKIVTKNGTDKVELGSAVTLKIDGETLTYVIVGVSESDPTAGKISADSPIGHSLMGKVKGENVEINTPNGKMTCKIIDIK